MFCGDGHNSERYGAIRWEGTILIMQKSIVVFEGTVNAEERKRYSSIHFEIVAGNYVHEFTANIGLRDDDGQFSILNLQ